jgi:hypothetical protein
MTIQPIHDYTLSTEELAMALSLVNRPDLGRMVIVDNLGELSQAAMEERLKAASHSLLARKFATIGKRGLAVLADELQDALTPLILFDGMIQIVVNDALPVITNFHLGLNGRFTAHWVEQGVVHRMVQADMKHLPQMASDFISLPPKISTKLESQIAQGAFKISMETFGDLTEMKFEEGLDVLIKNGLDAQLAKALLNDLLEPMKRGSANFIPIESKHVGQNLPQLDSPGLFFVVGKSSWIMAFPASGTTQAGSLIAGTSIAFEKCVRELVEKKSTAFA